MKTHLKLKIDYSERPAIELTYSAGFWEKLKTKLDRFGLQQTTTTKFFGQTGVTGTYYRDTSSSLGQFLGRRGLDTSSTLDDINRSAFVSGYINLAMFRAVPDSSNKVVIPLETFVTVRDITRLKSTMEVFFKAINEIVSKVEIEVRGD